MGRCGAALRLALEGNIAVGKSTFLRLLAAAFPRWHLVTEPVARWRRVPGAAGTAQAPAGSANLLQLLYVHEPLFSDRYVFAKTLLEAGHLQPLEWAIYQEWHELLLRHLAPHAAPHGFLYLRASPQTCLQRLRRRARSEEGGIQLGYLQQLHGQHELWLVARATEIHCEAARRAPVLVLDAEQDFEHDVARQGQLMAQVGATGGWHCLVPSCCHQSQGGVAQVRWHSLVPAEPGWGGSEGVKPQLCQGCAGATLARSWCHPSPFLHRPSAKAIPVPPQCHPSAIPVPSQSIPPPSQCQCHPSATLLHPSAIPVHPSAILVPPLLVPQPRCPRAGGRADPAMSPSPPWGLRQPGPAAPPAGGSPEI
ncbi:LOW QUALITY PROTEIN: deoxyguanosine kinase, mitochondrial [Camarhynchus parvulus]|uniref:LOW QUALITY PROTEIN: deoxyguanosine kinase, mitochondrial n=1 Tax=Geospiza parvula TaxID=87175 RepID=UPI001237A4C3|nr:LOW QUALITY PROTEIN: deoxyguanosine kinase, mitochondrial [Camarhynchus parvulus]